MAQHNDEYNKRSKLYRGLMQASYSERKLWENINNT